MRAKEKFRLVQSKNQAKVYAITGRSIRGEFNENKNCVMCLSSQENADR